MKKQEYENSKSPFNLVDSCLLIALAVTVQKEIVVLFKFHRRYIMKQSTLMCLIIITTSAQAQSYKSKNNRRAKTNVITEQKVMPQAPKENNENVRWVQPHELQAAVKEASASAANRATEQNRQATTDQNSVSNTPSDGIKPDMLLSLRNLLNFLASSHIKTGLPAAKGTVNSPCVAYTADGACIMVAQEGQASKWNVAQRSNLGVVNAAEVQKGSNISPDGSRKAIINGEERLIIIDTKTGEQIIGPSIAGYQIMLGKPKASWSHITPVWCPNGKQCAIAADGLVVLIDIPHLIEVDTFIKKANPTQLSLLEKIHSGYRTSDKTGKVQLAAQEKEIFNEFPAVVTKALKPYIQ